MRRLALLLLLSFSVVANLWARSEIIGQKGATVVGVVSCDGKPLEGVLVSDGALFTRTDSLGVYSLVSLKYYGSVFVITPSGYEPTVRRGNIPQFWAPLDQKRIHKVERHDFTLRKVDNNRHRMIFTADMHIAARNEDMLQFKRKCLPALRRAAAVKDSIPVYSVILGDLCRNDAWYSQDIDPSDVVSMLATVRYPAMFYTVMGENEYDGAVPAGILTDHEASKLYATTCAPRFYSFNIGQVHYVVLDNTAFRNDAGDGKYPTEIVGKRNYDRRVSADCLAWLRRDLQYVEDKSTPIVVCMHHSVIRMSNKNKIIKALSKAEDTDSLVSCFDDFSSVRFVTAHIHRRRVSKPKELKNITEHTVTSLSGNNWETGYNNFPHICSDGSPAGFEVFDYDGRDVKWQFCSVEDTLPFRLYDMRKMGEKYRTDVDIQNMLRAYPNKRMNYGDESYADYVYINYWCEEPGTKLEVWDDTKQLKPRRVYHDDPIYTQATTVIRHKNSRGKKINIPRNSPQHLFRVKTDSTSTHLRVRAVDSFGREAADTLFLL
jgi:hypothetical protein